MGWLFFNALEVLLLDGYVRYSYVTFAFLVENFVFKVSLEAEEVAEFSTFNLDSRSLVQFVTSGVVTISFKRAAQDFRDLSLQFGSFSLVHLPCLACSKAFVLAIGLAISALLVLNSSSSLIGG